MKMPRIRASKLASAMLAGGVALSILLGPALLPPNTGGSVARADITIGISLFQSELSPYGRWAYLPDYGQVWYPVGMHRGWRPYYDDGHWVYSDDYGWLWVSDLPWGWAPFHYGRWVFDDDYGWVWVPGYTWGPAWVTFRSAPGYIGWAPLPPWAEWDDDYGFRRRYDVVDVRYWCFVRPEGFLEPRFDRYAYDRRDYPTIINRTTNITNITIINNHVVNRGIDVNHIERVTHQRVDHVMVSDSDRPDRTVLKGNQVVIYKPAVIEEGGGKRSRQNNRQNTNQGAPAQQFETNQQLRKKRGNQAPEFGQPEQMQPSFGTNEQPQVPRKKKRFNDQNQAPEFNQPEQMQPSFGTNEQPQTRSKRQQQPEFAYPDNGGSSGGDFQTVPQKKRQRSNEQFNDQPQAQQQYQPQGQQYRQQEQQQQVPVNKKSKRQCQSGDPTACGN